MVHLEGSAIFRLKTLKRAVTVLRKSNERWERAHGANKTRYLCECVRCTVLCCAMLCSAMWCAVFCCVVLCSVFFILFACSMYWDACIRSPSIHMLCVMSSFKRFAIAFCALFSNLNDTEKAMAHNTQQQCKYSWRVQRMQSPGDIERNSMEKRAQRIVISEHESKKKEKNTKNRKKEQTNGDNYYVLCARRAKQ